MSDSGQPHGRQPTRLPASCCFSDCSGDLLMMVLRLRASVLAQRRHEEWQLSGLVALFRSPVLLALFLVAPFCPLSLDLFWQFLVRVWPCFRRPSRPRHTPGVLVFGTRLSLAAVLRLYACCPLCLSPLLPVWCRHRAGLIALTIVGPSGPKFRFLPEYIFIWFGCSC